MTEPDDLDLLKTRIAEKYNQVAVLEVLLKRLESEIFEDRERLRSLCEHEWQRDYQTFYGPCDRSHYYCVHCLESR